MTQIKRNAIVSYSVRQMFELVNNVRDYPRFIPWCGASHILHEDPAEIVARLDITWSGIHKNFTTRNQLTPFQRIDIALVDGPFRRLQGIWCFNPMGEDACSVELELEFELAGGVVDRLFQPIFHHMANSLVDLFCQRAVEVYGVR